MTGLRSLHFKVLFTLSALAATACGGDRQLQSVTVSPSAADAKGSPNSQVQFVATGIYSGSSTPVTLTGKEILWCYGGAITETKSAPGACAGNIAQFATVDQNGLAQCTSTSFQGTVYILAGTPAGSPIPDEGPQLKKFGSAQLTCP